MADVPLLDMTGAQSLAGFLRKAAGHGMAVTLAGPRPRHLALLRAAGLPADTATAPDVATARAAAAETPPASH
jgi:sulfate permease, SulP family